MKTTKIILIIFLFSIIGCSKEGNDMIQGLPVEYDLFLNIQKPGGDSFVEGEIEIDLGYLSENGEVVFAGEWSSIPVSRETSDMIGRDVFGPFFLGMSHDEYSEPENGTETVHEDFLLLRYHKLPQIDTLRLRTWAIYPEFCYFDIFKNDTLIQRFNDTDATNYVEPPWYITIQK